MCTCQERKHDIKDTVRFPQNMHVRRRIGNNWPRLCPYVTLTGWDSVQESFKEGNDKRQSLWRTPLGEKLFLGRERLDYPLPLMPLQPDPTVHPHLPWDHSSLTLTPSQSLPRKTTYEILYLNAPNFNTSPFHMHMHTFLPLKCFPHQYLNLGLLPNMPVECVSVHFVLVSLPVPWWCLHLHLLVQTQMLLVELICADLCSGAEIGFSSAMTEGSKLHSNAVKCTHLAMKTDFHRIHPQCEMPS